MVILKRTSFLLLLCLLLCSCHAGVGTVDFESARLSKPHDRQDDNLKGNVSKVEWTYYGWTGRTYTEDGKIVSLDKYVSKRIIRYSEKGVRISSLRYIAGKFNMLYEYDNDGRIMYHKHEDGSEEWTSYKMISDYIELVEQKGTNADFSGNETEFEDSYTIEYDKKGLPIVQKDKNGRITRKWEVNGNKEIEYYYGNDYPDYKYVYIYDRGILTEYRDVENGKVYIYNTKVEGETKTVTESLKSNPQQIVSIEEYKNNKLVKRVGNNGLTSIYDYNNNGDELRSTHPSGTNYYEYEYDKYGNWVVRREFGSDGSCSGISVRRISYYDDAESSEFLDTVLDKYLKQTPEVIHSHTSSKTEITVPVQRFKPCPSCLGGGMCSYCNGSGIYYHPGGSAACAVCGGYGKCSMCAGRGGEYVTEY